MSLGSEPQPNSVRHRAHLQQRASCGNVASELDVRLTTPGIIQSVSPLYTVTQTKHGIMRQLLGAELRVLAQPEVSAEWLERALKCHGALQTLGFLSEDTTSPYSLPDGWVEIDVISDGDGFRISLRGEDTDEARRILMRAQAYAARASNS